MKPNKVDKIYEVAVDGLTVELDLDAEAPNKFVCCYACDADGESDIPASGTVVYEVKTRTNPHWTDIEANNDLTAPTDSSFQAPANELRVTVSNEDAGMTHFRVVAMQYYA